MHTYGLGFLIGVGIGFTIAMISILSGSSRFAGLYKLMNEKIFQRSNLNDYIEVLNETENKKRAKLKNRFEKID